MTDAAMELKVTAASDIQVDTDALDASINEFAGPNGDYYCHAFHKIHDSTGFLPTTFNMWAAILGPLWSASRAIWGMFWAFLILEIIAWVQIGRGAWGNPGSEFLDRAATQQGRADEFYERAQASTEQADVDRFTQLGDNLARAAETSLERAAAAQSEAFGIMMTGLVMLVVFKLIQGFYGNKVYERQYSRWRIDPDSVESGRTQRNMLLGGALTAAIGPLIVYKFTSTAELPLLDSFPEDEASALILGEGNGSLFSTLATWMEARIDAAAIAGGDVFDGIVAGVRGVLDALTIALIDTPWPVVMLVICVVAWRSAGPRVAIFTAAALAYTAMLGYWDLAMETVALVGAAVILCVAIGIP
ncbi:MAG: proline/glycine betaine ABC transporter permease, partial [Pseudomonadota bacterium]